MNKRDVSIIIPTFNRPRFLSMILQTYVNQKNLLEIIIIDDASIDDYFSVINDYKNRFPNINFIYEKLKNNMGQAYCRNYGIKLAKGKYIMMGEDDVYLENNYVEVLRNKILTKKPKKIFICGNIFYEADFNLNPNEKQKLIKKNYSEGKELFNYKHFFGYYGRYAGKDVEVPFAHALIMVEAEAYKNVLYFENYPNSFREESDGQILLTKKGYLGYITSDTRCFHLPSSSTHKTLSTKELIKRNIQEMKANKLFWNRNYKLFKYKYGYKYPKFFPVITHNLRHIKADMKTAIYNMKR